ncbi:MAG: peptide ABC transporter permease, partial [Methanobrevibacter sp.]|nr:peptide ABC transporter permease [Methanobrevibacter sp.]
DNLKMLFYSSIILFIISTMSVSCQTHLEFFTGILYSLLVFIIIFVVYQLTKLLHYAKRRYSVIVGEYMSLVSILVFILGLTYESTRNLDYTMFSSFLILTPTYQLIYVVIGIIVVLVAGVLINDKGGNL